MASRSFEPIAVLGMYTETPLHCGTEAGSGFVDLPIQRERHTGFPVIPGSTIKGVLKDEDDWGGQRDRFFGAEKSPGGKDTVPGTISFTDGFLLAFPVRSTTVPFAWVTCPLILERFGRAMKEPIAPGKIQPGNGWSDHVLGDFLLEDLVVHLAKAPTVNNVSVLAPIGKLLPQTPAFDYTRKIFSERLIAVADEDFSVLMETATEVVTRIHLDEKSHTTGGDNGNMFNEELVPRDALFFSVLRKVADPQVAFPIDKMPKTIRLGGDETIGRGVTWVRCHKL